MMYLIDEEFDAIEKALSLLPHDAAFKELSAEQQDIIVRADTVMVNLLKKRKKYIHIHYSWGDYEYPITVPDDEDAWEFMKKLAIDEAEEAYCEHVFEGFMGLEFFTDDGRINLQYGYDDVVCYYHIEDTNEIEWPKEG